MLILTRRVGEAIYINGQEIKIRVLETNSNQAKIGIEAPDNMIILREEILNRDKKDKAA